MNPSSLFTYVASPFRFTHNPFRPSRPDVVKVPPTDAALRRAEMLRNGTFNRDYLRLGPDAKRD